MARSLLVLVLIGMQLLSGSGISVYICLRSDGAIRLVSGPEACDTCQEPSEGCGRSCNHSSPKHPAPPSEEQDQSDEIPSDLVPAFQDRGCTHLPVVVASDPAEKALARISPPVDRDGQALPFALPGPFETTPPVTGLGLASGFPISSIRNFVLGMVSISVMRC